MFRRTISILLIAGIVICPLSCTAAHGGAAKGDGEGPACCHAHPAKGAASDDSGSKRDNSRDSGKRDGCICSGAVTADSAAHALAIDTSWSLPLVVVDPIIHSLERDLLERHSILFWPDDGVNAGRALCCLYSTLLC